MLVKPTPCPTKEKQADQGNDLSRNIYDKNWQLNVL